MKLPTWVIVLSGMAIVSMLAGNTIRLARLDARIAKYGTALDWAIPVSSILDPREVSDTAVSFSLTAKYASCPLTLDEGRLICDHILNSAQMERTIRITNRTHSLMVDYFDTTSYLLTATRADTSATTISFSEDCTGIDTPGYTIGPIDANAIKKIFDAALSRKAQKARSRIPELPAYGDAPQPPAPSPSATAPETP